MTKKITIITAYFDIGRGSMKNFERTTNDYFDYFTKWAKLKNNLVVFVENEKLKKEVLNFREKIGLLDKTTVVVIEDIISLAPDIYKNIRKAISNEILLKYRLRPQSPDSNNSLYNYVMILKAWCIAYTANELKVEGQLAWIDFGFNHGGTVFSLESNFNIMWEYDFGEKITLFNLQPLDDRPIFDIIFSMDTYIMGSIIIVPDKLASIFWELAQYCTKILSEVGISDDDQIIWLMSCRMKPDFFDIKKVSGWHTALKEYGCADLVLKKIHKDNKLKLILRKVKYRIEIIKYIKQIYSISIKWTQQ